MAAQRKNNRKRRARKLRPRPPRALREADAWQLVKHDQKVRHAAIEADPTEREIFTTPLGTYRTHTFANELHIRNPKLAVEISQELPQDDQKIAAHLREIAARYPDEPYPIYQSAIIGLESRQRGAEEELRQAYQRFPDYPALRYAYAATFARRIDWEELRTLVGTDPDLHARHPDWRFFAPDTVANFLSAQAEIVFHEKEYEEALQYVEALHPIDPNLARILLTTIDLELHPWKRVRSYLTLGGIVLLALGILAAVGYGLFRLVLWLF